MHPILFRFGSLEVHSYGVMVAVAAVLAGYVLRWELQRRGGRGDAAFALTLAGTIGGFVGARVYFLLEHLGHTSLAGSLSGAGFTWYGGVLGGAAAVLVVARRRGIALPVLLGSFAPALALGYGVGRVACQLAGDGTYGIASGLPWAMSYPHGEIPTPQRVHPTPVYETLASLLIFAILWRLRTRVAPVRLFGLYLVFAGIARFLVEFIRRNQPVLLGLSQPQLFAGALGLIGVALLILAPACGARASPSAPATA